MKPAALLGAFFGAIFFATGPALAADYKIDIPGQHAFITFKASHLGYSFIVGGFNDFDGKFSHDPANPAASKVNVTIDAGSLDTNHAERDKHLRSDDFFDVASYPTISFDSTGYQAGAEGDKLTGNLTMLGVTREVEVDVKHIGEGKDPWGGYRSGFSGNVEIDAADFGLPQWVGKVLVELNIEGVRI